MIHAPINAFTWTLGSVALYTFGYKSWRAYQRTKNPLGKMYSALGLSFGTAVFFLGVPGFLTHNPHVLLLAYLAADFFIEVSLQVQAWLLWFIGLRSRFRLKQILAFTIPFSATIFTLEVFTSRVAISHSPYLIVSSDVLVVSVLKSIIYTLIAMPLGYFFLLQARHQTTARAKLKSFTTGMIFLAVWLAAIINNIFDKGGDNYSSAIIVMVFFAIFLAAQLLRRSQSGRND